MRVEQTVNHKISLVPGVDAEKDPSIIDDLVHTRIGVGMFGVRNSSFHKNCWIDLNCVDPLRAISEGCGNIVSCSGANDHNGARDMPVQLIGNS